MRKGPHVAGDRLDRMADRVAEIEHRSRAGLFALVRRDHARLEPAAPRRPCAMAARVAGQKRRRRVCSSATNSAGIEDHAVLDHLGQPAAKLAIGQGVERARVDPDSHRLVKGADHVLGAGWLMPDLAPDRAVDLGEERGRHHDQGKSAREGGGDEAGQVADHAAAQGDDQRVAIGAPVDQLVVEPPSLRERFGGLAGGNDRIAASMPTAASAACERRGSRQLREMRSVTMRAVRQAEPAQVRRAPRGQTRRTLGAPAVTTIS